jgi:hypothetical protein
MNHPAAPLLLSDADRETLTKWAQSASAPYRVVTGVRGNVQSAVPSAARSPSSCADTGRGARSPTATTAVNAAIVERLI